MPSHHPHDKLLKISFGDPENAAGLLRGELPGAISEKIDWTRLKLEPGSFVDSHYRHSESDLLFSAPIEGSACFLYILFEHQSTPDSALALRLLRYMVRIWERMLEEDPNLKLAPIFPVVLAQNAEVWRLSPRFSALFDVPPDIGNEVLAFIPDFLFRLVQLASLPFDAIQGTPAGIVTLRILKAERTGDLLGEPVWDEELLGALSRRFLDFVVRYIADAGVDKNAFEGKVLVIANPKIRSAVMTIAEELRQEGMQKGMQKGMRKGMQQGILANLEVRFRAVPEGLREAVEAVADEERLRSLHRASLSAESLEEFSRSL